MPCTDHGLRFGEGAKAYKKERERRREGDARTLLDHTHVLTHTHARDKPLKLTAGDRESRARGPVPLDSHANKSRSRIRTACARARALLLAARARTDRRRVNFQTSGEREKDPVCPSLVMPSTPLTLRWKPGVHSRGAILARNWRLLSWKISRIIEF